MSEFNWDSVDDEDQLPTLKTEEDRDEWIDLLMSQDDDEDWCKAMVVRNGDDMVMRIKFDDGREEIYDCVIRRAMELVLPDDADLVAEPTEDVGNN